MVHMLYTQTWNKGIRTTFPQLHTLYIYSAAQWTNVPCHTIVIVIKNRHLGPRAANA